VEHEVEGASAGGGGGLGGLGGEEEHGADADADDAEAQGDVPQQRRGLPAVAGAPGVGGADVADALAVEVGDGAAAEVEEEARRGQAGDAGPEHHVRDNGAGHGLRGLGAGGGRGIGLAPGFFLEGDLDGLGLALLDLDGLLEGELALQDGLDGVGAGVDLLGDAEGGGPDLGAIEGDLREGRALAALDGEGGDPLLQGG
jgi:hypothetical protein